MTFFAPTRLSKLFLMAQNCQIQWTFFPLHSVDLLWHFIQWLTDLETIPSFGYYVSPPIQLDWVLFFGLLHFVFIFSQLLLVGSKLLSQTFNLELYLLLSCKRPFIHLSSIGSWCPNLQHLGSSTIWMLVLLGIFMCS